MKSAKMLVFPRLRSGWRGLRLSLAECLFRAILVVLLVLATASAANAESKMYWTDAGTTNKIQSTNLDGTGVEDLVTHLDSPQGIALDTHDGKMYWTNAGTTNNIQRSNLDGTGVEDLFTRLDSPQGIALDIAGGKMYWTNAGTAGKIQRANLDGTGKVEGLVTHLDSPQGIALDIISGKMYWTNAGTAGKIQRANLDGTGVEDLVTRLDSPQGIALDIASGKMYWTDAGTTNKIQRANLDGTGAKNLVAGLEAPRGIALDIVGGKMYWTEDGTKFNKIRRANLDGSGVEDLVTGLDAPQGIALDLDTEAFTYQGRLIDANSAADSLYDFQFELYDGPADGNQQGSTIYINELDVIDGYFTVELGFGSAVFNGDDRWLEIAVRPGDSNEPNAFVTLSPRQEVTPTPYAIYAKTAPTGHSLDAADGSPMNAVYVDDEGNVGIGTTSPAEKLSVAGIIESTSGGVKFPDGSVQTTSATVPLADLESLTASLQARIEALENPPGWGTAELIETYNTGDARCPQVAFDGSGNAVAVWEQSDGTRYNIWSNRYVAGTGWGTAELIETDNAGFAYSPQVAVTVGGNAVAVWRQYDGTRYNIWSNHYVAGTGWGTAELIETDNAGWAYSPQVAVDGSGNAAAVWYQHDGTRNNIWSNRYVAGTGWGTAELIETDNAGDAYRPQVAVHGGGNAVAVWRQDDGTRYNIWSNCYVAGTGWGTAELIETDTGDAEYQQVAVDGGGNAVAVWRQDDGTRYNIWSNRYVAGTGWGTAELIETNNAGHVRYPQVAVDVGGNAVAVWEQSDGTRYNIWSNHYVAGTGWGTAELIETDNAGWAYSPQVAVDGSGNAVAVWYQHDGTRYNIWSNRYVK